MEKHVQVVGFGFLPTVDLSKGTLNVDRNIDRKCIGARVERKREGYRISGW